ncbi:MAG: hypothetical protein ACI9W2_001276, partial [Gammaproteobacteria bacterium]
WYVTMEHQAREELIVELAGPGMRAMHTVSNQIFKNVNPT